MIDIQDFIWGFSIISLLLYFIRGLGKSIRMALSLDPPPSSSPPPPPLPWVGRLFVGLGGRSMGSNNQTISDSLINGQAFAHQEYPRNNLHGMMCQEENIMQKKETCCEAKEKVLHDKYQQDNSCILEDQRRQVVQEKGIQDEWPQENSGILVSQESDSASGVKGFGMLRKRPARLVVPLFCPALEFGEKGIRDLENKEFEVEGTNFFLASKKGRRDIMEDRYEAMVDILGDPKQAFFAVIDGHGGCPAADYVAKNLGKNIVKTLGNVVKAEDELEQAIRGGYSVTDKEFLNQGVSSGACASSVLLKDGELHVANVGDCRVVLSRKGVAYTLTNDHRLTREDERSRIESSGGFVHCRNGVWRVHGSLAISRAIGDQHLKKWIISEPEIKKLRLSSDCDFLIMASDGLWDKVNDQEAVDVVSRDKNSIESCKKLVDMSSSRGNMDDITVMVINLQKFMASGD
ncbi:hypothetical protein L1049_026438 [Liquidambar formosana]|uniref:PPM-type phosphatase domain-containing protein n=1 Tax=Liquidambar formosana TaxID=63359 RepID=A0AAP0R5G5_LIQFO